MQTNVPETYYVEAIETLCNEILLCKESIFSLGNQVQEIVHYAKENRSIIEKVESNLPAFNKADTVGIANQNQNYVEDIIINTVEQVEKPIPSGSEEKENKNSLSFHRIEMIGDSHIRGIKSFLKKKVPHNLEVSENFESGATMFLLNEILSIPDSPEIKYAIMLGPNDVKRTEYEVIIEYLDKLLTKLQNNQVYFMLLPLRLDHTHLNENIIKLNTKLKYHIINKYDNVLIINPNNALRENHSAVDGQHMNRFGKVKIANLLHRSVHNYYKYIHNQNSKDVKKQKKTSKSEHHINIHNQYSHEIHANTKNRYTEENKPKHIHHPVDNKSNKKESPDQTSKQTQNLIKTKKGRTQILILNIIF